MRAFAMAELVVPPSHCLRAFCGLRLFLNVRPLHRKTRRSTEGYLDRFWF
jgi:hypothetical protein